MSDRNLTQSHHSNVYGNFLMHWKYIKREKVNGKWKYYYDDGKITKGAAYEAQAATERAKQKLDTVNSAIEIRNKAILARNKEIVDAKMEQKKLVDANIARIKEGKATLNTVYERGKAKDKQLTAENNKQKLIAEKKALENEAAELKREITKAEQEAKKLAEEYANSPAAKGYSTADKIKDALGVDERAEYKEAKAKYDNAKEHRSEASRDSSDAIKAYGELPRLYGNEDEYKRVSQWLHDSVSSHTFWKETAYERGKEYTSAKHEYMETPLGTALKITEAVEDVPYKVERALEKLTKKLKKK